MELYTTVEWGKLRAEVAKLRISLAVPPEKAPGTAHDVTGSLGAVLGAVKDETPRSRGVEWWRRRESKLLKRSGATCRRGTPFVTKALRSSGFELSMRST